MNLKGNRDGLTDKLKNLLDYLDTSMPTDAFTKHIEHEVSKVKSDDEWRGNFMTLEQKIEEERRFARKQGEEQKLLHQISKKLDKGKSIPQIADECEETEERIKELMEKL